MCVSMYALELRAYRTDGFKAYITDGLRVCITDISFVSMSQLILCIIHPTVMAKYCDFACYTSSYSANELS